VTDLRHRILHHLLIRHIALVPHQQLVHTLRRVAINLLQPLLDIVEAVHIGDIVDDADAVCAAVVRGSDGAKALLPGRVPLNISISPMHTSTPPTPTTGHVDYSLVRRFVRVRGTYNLQLHRLAIELDRPDLEVHPDSRDVALRVRVVGESQEQAGLSDAGVADEEQLEEVVVSEFIQRQPGGVHVEHVHEREGADGGLGHRGCGGGRGWQ